MKRKVTYWSAESLHLCESFLFIEATSSLPTADFVNDREALFYWMVILRPLIRLINQLFLGNA